MVRVIHFLGDLLIFFSIFIRMLRIVFKFMIILGIVMGIFGVTIMAAFDLVSPDVNVFGKPIWSILILVIGLATMWQGISKGLEEERELRKPVDTLMDES